MSAGFVTAHLDAIEPIVFGSDDEPDWRPLRHELGIGAFGVNAWVAKAPGDQAIERHDEAPAEGGSERPRGAVRRRQRGGALHGRRRGARRPGRDARVRLRPDLTREAVATAPDTTVIVVGAARGVAFEPSDWEVRWLRKLGRL